MHVTLRQLRAALAVAQHRSFRRAADELNLTGPAVSIAIGELERTLGVTLFDRTSRMVRTTELGQTFLLDAGRLVGDLTQLIEHTSGVAKSRQGRVVIACLASLGARVLPDAIRSCAKKYPAIEVLVRDDVSSTVVSGVRSGEADFGLVGVVVELDDRADDLVFEPLASDPFQVVFLKTHPFASKAKIKWTDLQGESFVGFAATHAIHVYAEKEMRRQKVTFAGTIGVTQVATVHGMLEAGLGISILPTLALPFRGHPLLEYRPLVAPTISRTIGLLRRRDRSLSPAAAGFYEVLREVISPATSKAAAVRMNDWNPLRSRMRKSQ